MTEGVRVDMGEAVALLNRICRVRRPQMPGPRKNGAPVAAQSSELIFLEISLDFSLVPM